MCFGRWELCCLGLWFGECNQWGICVMRKRLINILQKVTGALVGMRGADDDHD